MCTENSRRRGRAFYQVSFADEDWEEIRELSRFRLVASEMLEYVELWNEVQNKVARNRFTDLDLLARAVYMTLEVQHEQEQETGSNGN